MSIDKKMLNAAKSGIWDLVWMLIENGANLHANKDNLLIIAAHHGEFDIFRKLVEENGLNPNGTSPAFGSITEAIKKGRQDIFEYAFYKMPKIAQQKDRYRYPLVQSWFQLAECYNRPKMFKILLDTYDPPEKFCYEMVRNSDNNEIVEMGMSRVKDIKIIREFHDTK